MCRCATAAPGWKWVEAEIRWHEIQAKGFCSVREKDKRLGEKAAER